VDVGDHRTCQSNGRGFVGKDPNHPAAELDLLVEALDGLVLQI
jgi:hypothetical protein